MTEDFGTLPTGDKTTLYIIENGGVTAAISDFGATLVRLLVPDVYGCVADVVLGYDNCLGYLKSNACFGGTIGRNANRIHKARFTYCDTEYILAANNGEHNLHSGPDYFHKRLWKLKNHSKNSVKFELISPHEDQGFPGNALIQVAYELDRDGSLHILYEGISDQDTVFNLTNHSYFNLAGHEHTDRAMTQILTIQGNSFCPTDSDGIPTGELRPVDGTPMDFRTPKPILQDIDADYEPLRLQSGYDHNWVVHSNPCAVLEDPASGRRMEIHSDCPGIQVYTPGAMHEFGKNGVHYGKRSGVALETQYYPDALHNPAWPQPITKAGQHYTSETVLRFNNRLIPDIKKL